MKKLLAIDFQILSHYRTRTVEGLIKHLDSMKENFLNGKYEGTREDYVAKMRELFKGILRNIRALSALYAKYYGRLENVSRVMVDREIKLNSRFINRFIDHYSNSSWRVIKGLKLPQRFAYCD